jgi:hypothetical protein
LFQDKRKGETEKITLVAVMNKLIKQAFATGTKLEDYNEINLNFEIKLNKIWFLTQFIAGSTSNLNPPRHCGFKPQSLHQLLLPLSERLTILPSCRRR